MKYIERDNWDNYYGYHTKKTTSRKSTAYIKRLDRLSTGCIPISFPKRRIYTYDNGRLIAIYDYQQIN